MNSVSVWYQLLTAAMPSLAIMLLWLTCLSDPGMIPPSCTRDPIIDQLEFARAGEDEERHSQTPKEGYSKEPGERGAWTRTLIREGVPYTEKCKPCLAWTLKDGYAGTCDILSSVPVMLGANLSNKVPLMSLQEEYWPFEVNTLQLLIDVNVVEKLRCRWAKNLSF
eukprot:scaffold181984_cov23-Tisochrysis_lutea.AAC.1